MPENGESPAPARSSEDILTPIHKALRSMIYELGYRLQTTDFTDADASELVLADLLHEFGPGTSARCTLCLLHAHAGHEDRFAFGPLRSFDPALIDELVRDHMRFSRELGEVARNVEELRAVTSPDDRVALGKELTLAVNRFFAGYLAHMNREEAELVPLMNRSLSDEELRAMRGLVEQSMAPDRLQELHRWILVSLNANELVEMFRSIRRDAPPETFAYFETLARANIDPARWRVVEDRIGY